MSGTRGGWVIDKDITVVYTIDMKTILNVKVDKEEKEKAKQIALQMGVPLSTIINAHLREFIRTREFSVRLDPVLKPEVEKELIRMSKEYHKNPKSAYSFNSATEAIKFLRKK
ncbi:hypothetical protein A2819_02145 [Candidatus Azambacteria bacterium RIFCSPHIGHO2_01_FULL_40_24]|uniref:Uncharacterized protein n=1 Tax=Candidatus Azambacteria bacterium RIFCSPHIGHO2_01_FULL_40_24 TaxID=1797301 RepID=A0A1F5B5I3_9BACT|nr:MAG: hypothetical protein A2819_02145 [Candidatus Azambacteria bacterium RIFCSPHIGHO2_01_FULL_40_24]